MPPFFKGEQMQCVELNPVGNFDPWEEEKLDELLRQDISDALSNTLVFENENMKLWDLILLPGERIPFRRHNSNYVMACTTGGLALTRYGNGKIDMLKLEPGDSEFFEHCGKNYVNDLENIGEFPIVINILEYKQAQKDTSNIFCN